MHLRLAGITRESLIDGPGIRLVLFLQGCHLKCPGCHNPDTWDPGGGELLSMTGILCEIKEARGISGITFSGGEPFLQASALAFLGRQIKAMKLNLVTYTGFTFEDLWREREKEGWLELLATSDLLIDGPYKEEEQDLRLPFRGSRNQRIIDVGASLKKGYAVIYKGNRFSY